MNWNISRRIPGRRWGAAASLVVLSACGSTALRLDPTVTPKSPPLPLADVFVLESWGAPAEDTVVRFSPNQDRVITLRRGAPDNGLFARISFPAGSIMPANPGDTVAVTIRARPGLFGVDLLTDAKVTDRASLTFSYAIHFVAPAGARAVYGSDYRLERFLGISRVSKDSSVVFLDSWRVASDMLTAPLAGPGEYLVAAPRKAPAFKAIIW